MQDDFDEQQTELQEKLDEMQTNLDELTGNIEEKQSELEQLETGIAKKKEEPIELYQGLLSLVRISRPGVIKRRMLVKALTLLCMVQVDH